MVYGLTSNYGNVKWKRDDSLSGIVDLETFKCKSELHDQFNSYFESLENHGELNPLYLIPNILKRYISHYQRWTRDILDLVAWFSQKLGISTAAVPGTTVESDHHDIQYGRRQIIVIATGYNTVIAIDSKTSETLWR